MEVKNFMVKDVVTIEEDKTVKELLQLMVGKRIGGVPVVNKEKELIGIVTDGDLLRHLNPKTYVLYFGAYYKEDLDEIVAGSANTLVKDIMRKRVLYIFEDDTLESALKLISQHHFKKLPIVDDQKKVIGIVSRGDMMKKLAEDMLNQL